MAATRTRRAMGIVLLLVLVGTALYAGYLVWAHDQPDAIWARAQASLADGDLVAAKSALTRLLEKEPARARNHLAMAQVVLRIARQTQPRATYATTAEADGHLRQAIRLAKRDQDAALPVMHECLTQGLREPAAEMATVVLKREPQNADALYALAMDRALKGPYHELQEYLERLARLPSEPRVRTLVLQAGLAKAEQNQDALQAVAERSLRLAAQGPQPLGARDRARLDRLLMLSVQEAENAAAAVERTKATLDWRDARVAAGNKPPLPPQVAELAALLVQRWPAAELAACKTYPPLWRRLVESGRLVAAEESSPPETYRSLASLALIGGDSELSLRLTEEGLGNLEKWTKVPRTELSRLHRMAVQAKLCQRQFSSAAEHIQALQKQPADTGLASALAAYVALVEGRHENAFADLQAAGQRIGLRPVVRGMLAAYHMTRGAWREAAAQLDALQQTADVADAVSDGARCWVDVTLGRPEMVRLHQIRAWLMLGDDEQARRHVEALRGTKWEPHALAMQAGCLWASRRRPEANEVLQQARQAFPDDLPLAQLAMLFLLGEDRPAEAESLVREIAQRRPDDVGAQLLAVHWMLARRDLTAALSEVERLTKAFPGQTGLQVLRAQILLAAGQAEKALDALPAVAQRSSAQTAGALVAALAALQLGDFSGANLPPRDEAGRPPSGAVMLAASIALLARQYGQAADVFADAISFHGLRCRAVEAVVGELTTLADQAGDAAAQAKLEELLKRFPKERAFWSSQIDLLVRTGQWQQAAQTLDQLPSLPGEPARAAVVRARVYALLEQRQAAIEAGEQARKLLPADVATRLLLARQYLAGTRYDRAQEHVRDALQHEPNAWEAHVLRAEIYAAEGRAELCRKAVEESLRRLAEPLQREPARPELYQTAARLYQLGGAPDAALEVLKRGRREVPGSAALLAQQVEVHLARGEIEAAERLASEAAPAEPSAELCLLLGAAFQRHEALNAAELWARRGSQRAGPTQRAAAHLLLAGVALDQGKKTGKRQYFELAKEQYTAVLADCPRHTVAGNKLAWLLATHLEDADGALAVAEQVRGSAGPETLHPDFLATLLRVYRQTSRWTAGQEILEAAARAAPDRPGLQLELGLFHAATNNPAAARDALQQALRGGLDAERKQEAEHWISTLEVR